MRKNREEPDRPQGNEAARDDLGGDPRQVGPESAEPSGDPQRLSTIEDADNESTDELADTDQALEAGPVEGVEDAAEHPERPVHTHNEYGRPGRSAPRESFGSEEGLVRKHRRSGWLETA